MEKKIRKKWKAPVYLTNEKFPNRLYFLMFMVPIIIILITIIWIPLKIWDVINGNLN